MVDNKQQWKAWLYLAPAIVLLLVFTVWPIINTVRMAFTEGYNGLAILGGAKFSFGIGHFQKVIGFSSFINS
jgi:multiple sugar transport system permease protein